MTRRLTHRLTHTLTLTVLAWGLALGLSADRPVHAQDGAPPEPPAAGAEAPPEASALDNARERLTKLAAAQVKIKQRVPQLEAALTAEVQALELRKAGASADDLPGIELALERRKARISLARERVRLSEDAASIMRKVVATLEQQRQRLETGPGGLGIVVPTTDEAIGEALTLAEDETRKLEQLGRTRAERDAELALRSGELDPLAASLRDLRERLSTLEEGTPQRLEGEEEARLLEDELETLALKKVRAQIAAQFSLLEVAEAEAVLALRKAALESAPKDRLRALQEQREQARLAAAAEAETRRAQEQERELERLRAMRESAAADAEAATKKIERVGGQGIKRSVFVERDNARRTVRLADAEERRHRTAGELRAIETRFTEQRTALTAVRDRAAAGELSPDQIADHVRQAEAALQELETASVTPFEEGEALALEQAAGFEAERARLEQERLALEAGSNQSASDRRATQALFEAEGLLSALWEGQRTIAWSFDRLTELHAEQQAWLAAHLLDPAFRVLTLGNTRRQWAQAGGVLAGLLLLVFLVSTILRMLLVFTKKTKFTLDEVFVKNLRGPVRLALVIIAARILLGILTLPAGIRPIAASVISAFAVLCIVYAIYNMVDVVASALEPIVQRTKSRLDDQLLPLIRKILKVLIVIVGFCEVMRSLGYNVTSVLAGVSVGGIAIALAAKDTVSNLFGSIMIFT
ncbi:MAG: hypothetical protein ACYS22_02295, partial [Planctomycetota bacterium]